jgi:hypothetical protein
VLGRPVGDVGQAAGALGARCHILQHLLEFHQADGWGCWMFTGVTMPSTQIFSLGMPASLAK